MGMIPYDVRSTYGLLKSQRSLSMHVSLPSCPLHTPSCIWKRYRHLCRPLVDHPDLLESIDNYRTTDRICMRPGTAKSIAYRGSSVNDGGKGGEEDVGGMDPAAHDLMRIQKPLDHMGK